DFAATVTISMGVASLANAGDANLDDLITLSEKALAKAKKEGGNRLSIRNHPAGQ
ncbi:MAG: diguanylate cyclase, partial [Gammaproteobacteria bacterium]|nr:diguanylate cyclase [Gammaproteobacteria bacterium]